MIERHLFLKETDSIEVLYHGNIPTAKELEEYLKNAGLKFHIFQIESVSEETRIIKLLLMQ